MFQLRLHHLSILSVCCLGSTEAIQITVKPVLNDDADGKSDKSQYDAAAVNNPGLKEELLASTVTSKPSGYDDAPWWKKMLLKRLRLQGRLVCPRRGRLGCPRREEAPAKKESDSNPDSVTVTVPIPRQAEVSSNPKSELTNSSAEVVIDIVGQEDGGIG